MSSTLLPFKDWFFQNQDHLLALSQSTDSLYRRYPIPKKNRKQRWIEAPVDELKWVQNRLLVEVFYPFSPHWAAHGFVPHRSIVTHAQHHVGQKKVLTLDLVDFFPSTHHALLEDTLQPLLTPHSPSGTGYSNALLPADSQRPHRAPAIHQTPATRTIHTPTPTPTCSANNGDLPFDIQHRAEAQSNQSIKQDFIDANSVQYGER